MLPFTKDSFPFDVRRQLFPAQIEICDDDLKKNTFNMVSCAILGRGGLLFNLYQNGKNTCTPMSRFFPLFFLNKKLGLKSNRGKNQGNQQRHRFQRMRFGLEASATKSNSSALLMRIGITAPR